MSVERKPVHIPLVEQQLARDDARRRADDPADVAPGRKPE
jgi:hypothetical protein